MGHPGQVPPSAQPDPNHPLSRPPPGPGDLRWCGPNPRRPGVAEREPTHAQQPLVWASRSSIEGLSAITLATHDMSRAARFLLGARVRALAWRRDLIVHELSSRGELSQ